MQNELKFNKNFSKLHLLVMYVILIAKTLILIHAALKRSTLNTPFEFVKTNIIGSENVVSFLDGVKNNFYQQIKLFPFKFIWSYETIADKIISLQINMLVKIKYFQKSS